MVEPREQTDPIDQNNIPDPVVDNDQGGADDRPKWMAQLPKDLQDNESLTQYRSIGDAGKALSELVEFQKNAIVIPGEDASQEEREAYTKRIRGVEAADGYKFDKIELPKESNVQLSEQAVSDFKKACYDAALNPVQANALYKNFVANGLKSYNSGIALHNKATEKAYADLKSAWGSDYEDNIALVKKTIATFGSESLVQEFNNINSAIGNSVELTKAFAAIGKAISEDKFIGGKGSQKDGGRTVMGGIKPFKFKDMDDK